MGRLVDDALLPSSEPFERPECDRQFQHLARLIRQARQYLPGDLCAELVLALFAYSDRQLELLRQDLAEAEGMTGTEWEKIEDRQ